MNRRLLVLFVEDYLSDERPLQTLQELLIEILWDRRDLEPPEIIDLAKELDLRIAEFTGGFISADSLKELLRETAGLSPSVLRTENPERDLTWESSSETKKQSVALG